MKTEQFVLFLPVHANPESKERRAIRITTMQGESETQSENNHLFKQQFGIAVIGNTVFTMKELMQPKKATSIAQLGTIWLNAIGGPQFWGIRHDATMNKEYGAYEIPLHHHSVPKIASALFMMGVITGYVADTIRNLRSEADAKNELVLRDREMQERLMSMLDHFGGPAGLSKAVRKLKWKPAKSRLDIALDDDDDDGEEAPPEKAPAKKVPAKKVAKAVKEVKKSTKAPAKKAMTDKQEESEWGESPKKPAKKAVSKKQAMTNLVAKKAVKSVGPGWPFENKDPVATAPADTTTSIEEQAGIQTGGQTD